MGRSISPKSLVPCRMYLAAAREALGSPLPSCYLHPIPRSVGQGFQPPAGQGPQLNNDMRISLKAIGKGNRSKGFLFSNSFHLGKLELKNKRDIKSKLSLDNVDLGVTMPSTNINEYIRVLRLARKPSREEFIMIAKISMAGIGIIGTLGFVIYALLTELPKSF
jgi:protein transport protein SEC61 subunit gamma-like protein